MNQRCYVGGGGKYVWGSHPAPPHPHTHTHRLTHPTMLCVIIHLTSSEQSSGDLVSVGK